MSDTNRLIPKYKLHFQGTFLSHIFCLTPCSLKLGFQSLDFTILERVLSWPQENWMLLFFNFKMYFLKTKFHSVHFLKEFRKIWICVNEKLRISKGITQPYHYLEIGCVCNCLFVYTDCGCCWVCLWWFCTCFHGRCLWVLSGNSLCCCCFSVA